MAGRARVEDTATSPDSTEAGVANDGVWLQALSELTPVPRQYACPSVASADATTFLGCDAATLAALTDHGLPAYPSGYDQFDLINLALHARLGTSIPEVSLGFLLRFITDDPATWTTSMRWKFSAQGSCAPHSDDTAARDRTPVAGERWVVWAPEVGHNNTAPQAANGKVTVVGPTLRSRARPPPPAGPRSSTPHRSARSSMKSSTPVTHSRGCPPQRSETPPGCEDAGSSTA